MRSVRGREKTYCRRPFCLEVVGDVGDELEDVGLAPAIPDRMGQSQSRAREEGGWKSNCIDLGKCR